MTRPIVAEIDLSALEHNLHLAKRRARDAQVMAVVKANAYGHGLLRAAEAMRAADAYGILELDGALALREAGVRQPILMLEGAFAADELPVIAQQQLWSVVHCRDQLEMLSGAGVTGIDVFLKLNSGMNRLGFPLADTGAVLAALKSLPAVRNIALMTHFASADEPGGHRAALERFRQATAGLPHPRSLANSAALLADAATHGDWVRPGIMLYGASPVAGRSGPELGLRPAMTLKSRVIAVHDLRPGERVGYGGTFTADMPMRIGTVACGYADGYPRHAATGTPVLVGGRRTRTLGRVSMDMMAVDLTPVSGAGIGTEVELWGKGMPVDDVARACGTIGYELLCHVTGRVPVVSI